MHILICGSRDFVNAHQIVGDWVRANVQPSDTVIHGEAIGPDRVAGHFAREVGATVVGEPITQDDKDTYGMKRAGIIRNERMYDTYEPDLVVAFWNGTSRGTKHMMDYAIRQGCKVAVVREDAHTN